MIHHGNNYIPLIRAQLIHILRPIPTLQSGMCLSRARENTEGVRPRSEADMFINSNVTVIKAKGTFSHLAYHTETENRLPIWL